MSMRPLARWAMSIAALVGFSVLAAGSASPDLEAQFEEVARQVEEDQRRREAQEDLLRDGRPDAPQAAPVAVSHDPAVKTVEHGSGTGTVKAKSGSSVVLGFDGTPPAKGTTVEMKIKVVENIFGADVEAELIVGIATVTSVSSDAFGVEITEEKSKISVDGDELDHFATGNEILVSW
ncbi:MAG: hypothetical protein AB8H79_08055 [Myxococcota bacterium]